MLYGIFSEKIKEEEKMRTDKEIKKEFEENLAKGKEYKEDNNFIFLELLLDIRSLLKKKNE